MPLPPPALLGRQKSLSPVCNPGARSSPVAQDTPAPCLGLSLRLHRGVGTAQYRGFRGLQHRWRDRGSAPQLCASHKSVFSFSPLSREGNFAIWKVPFFPLMLIYCRCSSRPASTSGTWVYWKDIAWLEEQRGAVSHCRGRPAALHSPTLSLSQAVRLVPRCICPVGRAAVILHRHSCAPSILPRLLSPTNEFH